ncbi:MAG: hypothetical protein A2782_03550 [Candidatus Blackburnbacteria bacterium RIFCSPHIGHO2_01_FULL_43_15b]|uniref:Uncharacterized protein n=1 Tax=Candidatus Blackburnbacteria bacterium RIFCSPHIGHO2_01_FULL_43_15b TaxID=1797513 RepID=A0A1G1V384_9BACT|nr:MAG: hypothetical protein A2782_03550 [Candidatus Blackburnbacteria bacterium RIFCSPHIGHO2_01_FULL_43_15b]
MVLASNVLLLTRVITRPTFVLLETERNIPPVAEQDPRKPQPSISTPDPDAASCGPSVEANRSVDLASLQATLASSEFYHAFGRASSTARNSFIQTIHQALIICRATDKDMSRRTTASEEYDIRRKNLDKWGENAIGRLHLDSRVFDTLLRNNIENIDQLRSITQADQLAELRWFGPVAVKQAKEEMHYFDDLPPDHPE